MVPKLPIFVNWHIYQNLSSLTLKSLNTFLVVIVFKKAYKFFFACKIPVPLTYHTSLYPQYGRTILYVISKQRMTLQNLFFQMLRWRNLNTSVLQNYFGANEAGIAVLRLAIKKKPKLIKRIWKTTNCVWLDFVFQQII